MLEDGYFHGLGHGVGLGDPRAPYMGRLGDDLLAGDVVTVEPGCYRRGFGGCRLEDLVRRHGGRLRDPDGFPVRPVSSLGGVTPTLPLLHSGKVRELYDLGDDLLMVASDRISTYDVVHPTPIPDKGGVLTGLSVLWFGLTRDIVPNHFVSATDGVPDEFRGRALRVRRLEMLPEESDCLNLKYDPQWRGIAHGSNCLR